MNTHYDYPHPSARMVTFGAGGMVATSQQLAAQAGLEMLKKGGNAIDAAVATAACLTVVEPCSNGIGGDAFALVWNAAEGKLYGLNSSGAAPMALTAEAVRSAGHSAIPARGLLPITVPGVPAAWAELSTRLGKLSLLQALRPAVDYAQEGFVVSPTVAERWKEAAEETFAPLRGRPEFDEWFRVFTDDGRAPEAGELWTLPDHANTLIELGRTDCESFYRGAVADVLDRYMESVGGCLRKSDLAAHAAEWVEPLSVDYRGHTVWELPPNGQGMAALMALQVLSGFELPPVDDPRAWHLAIEALKLGMTDAEHHIADPRTMAVSPAQLLDPAYAAARRALIGARALEPQPGSFPDGGTVYLCTADDEGNMVSYIQSNFKGFGSGVVVPGTGIALHDRGVSFTLDSSRVNALQGGKKPFHTIIPGFLTRDGQPLAAFGVMGAAMQPQGHFQVVSSLVDRQLNPQAALDAPRWMWLGGKRVIAERSVPHHIVSALARMGHEISYEQDRTPFGRGQIILRQPNGVYAAGTEPRCDGAAVGW